MPLDLDPQLPLTLAHEYVHNFIQLLKVPNKFICQLLVMRSILVKRKETLDTQVLEFTCLYHALPVNKSPFSYSYKS